MTRLSGSLLNFHNLSQLKALELGMISPEEGRSLGLAVRESTLEKLHIGSTDICTDSQQESEDGLTAAVTFLSAIATGIAVSREGREYKGVSSGLPPSLLELAIEDDSYS